MALLSFEWAGALLETVARVRGLVTREETTTGDAVRSLGEGTPERRRPATLVVGGEDGRGRGLTGLELEAMGAPFSSLTR